TSHFALAGVLRETGQVRGAAQASRRALESFERLTAEFPRTVRHRHLRAHTQDQLDYLLFSVRQPAEAEDAPHGAVARLPAHAAAFPDLPHDRQQLAGYWQNLGSLLGDADRLPEALDACRKALDLREQLVKNSPKMPDYWSELAVARNNLAVRLAA